MVKQNYLSVVAYGKNILERYIGEDGTEHRRKVPYQPTLFVHTTKETGYTDIYGKNCLPKLFDTMPDARQFIKDKKDIIDILGMDDFQISYISDMYKDRSPDTSRIRIANIDIEVPSPEFPNPEESKYEIKSIVHYDSIDDLYYVFGIASSSGEWSSRQSIVEPDLLDKVRYTPCVNEKELLVSYISLWRDKTPVIVTGWNCAQFDIPYIARRLEMVLGVKAQSLLSPWGLVKPRTSRDDFGNDVTKYNLVGVEILDYLDLYKKFTFTSRPSFRLDYIGEVEVGRKKVEFKQNSYLEFYNEDYQNFIDYNIMDVELVKLIDESCQLLNLAVTMSYYDGINFSDVMGTVKPWDANIFNSLKKDRKVVPMSKGHPQARYMGAFVKQPVPGLYEDVAAFDLTSLYPMCIIQNNISPETIVAQLESGMPLVQTIDSIANRTFKYEHGDYAVSANGMLYRKDIVGVIPKEIEKVFWERKQHKNQMLEHERNVEAIKRELHKRGSEDKYSSLTVEELNAQLKHEKSRASQEDIEQMARKIKINSLYGALGNRFFRYYSLQNAEAVTSFGQLAIKWTNIALNEYMNKVCSTSGTDYVVYNDTDSAYITLKSLMKRVGKDDLLGNARIDVMDTICKKIESTVIRPSYVELSDYMNAYQNRMAMDREVLATRGFWTGKKRYALNVYDNEGTRYEKPKVKIMGIETQRISTPPLAQKGLKEAIRIIVQEDEPTLQEYVAEFKSKWNQAEYHDISFVSSANNLAKYSDDKLYPTSGCPGHVKGVLAYNRYAREVHSDPIQEGEKVAILELKEPNKFNSASIAYVSGTNLPNEVDPAYVISKINKPLIYNKRFISPLANICDAIKWDYEKSFSLDAFF